MLIKIILAVAALGLGIWLGLPGRYEQNDRDIERAMDQGGARRNQVRKVFTPMDWFSRSKRGSARRREPSRFSTAAPLFKPAEAKPDQEKSDQEKSDQEKSDEAKSDQ